MGVHCIIVNVFYQNFQSFCTRGVQKVVDIIASRFHGIVREFDRNRGLGTIELDNGENVSVRYSAIIGEGVRILRSGDRVACDVEVTHKGSCAVRVERE